MAGSIAVALDHMSLPYSLVEDYRNDRAIIMETKISTLCIFAIYVEARLSGGNHSQFYVRTSVDRYTDLNALISPHQRGSRDALTPYGL